MTGLSHATARKRNEIRLAAVLAAAAATLPHPLRADAIRDLTDPLLMNGVTVPLPPAAVPPDALAFEFTRDGVTFRFESLSGQPLSADGTNVLVWNFGGAGGVVVTINPAVSAIAFQGRGLDGVPGGVFVGTGSTETVLSNEVFGSGDIGAISTVRLEGSGVFTVSAMTFVPLPAGPGLADSSIAKRESRPAPGRVLNGDPLDYRLRIENAGPDDALNVRVTDFLPRDALFASASTGGIYLPDVNVVTWAEPPLAAGTARELSVAAAADPDFRIFGCNERLTNVSTISALTGDPALANNLGVVTTSFDTAALFEAPEICDDGIDNNCDGRTDCSDTTCFCRPTLPSIIGAANCNTEIVFAPIEGPPLTVTTCAPGDTPAAGHACQVPRGRCGGVTLPAFCCDAGRLSDPSLDNLNQLRTCDVGVPGCAPVDPNFKEADPPVNIAGFGYTAPGRRMTYTIHYENIGNADALDVKVIDVLDPNLDEATLAIENGGTYDSSSRAVVWSDSVVPPGTPRTVRFHVDVRAGAAPATHVRNVATIVFPNAVPPSRIDTEPVEHVVPDPAFPIGPKFRIRGCEPAGPGVWNVGLVNEGVGFAYNVTATIVRAPEGVTVTDRDAAFSHPDDPDPDVLATVIPNATSTSRDTVGFDAGASGDPCGTFDWRVRWENLRGEAFTADLPGAPGNRAPSCERATAAPPMLWPPDHDLVPVDITGVSDPDGDAVTIAVASVRQDEPVDAQGDGRTAPDALADGSRAHVRAERSGGGNGRVYRIAFTASDGRGGDCAGEVTVCVPHDRSEGRSCTDDGAIYDALGSPVARRP